MRMVPLKGARPVTYSRWHRTKHTDPRHLVMLSCDDEDEVGRKGPHVYFVHQNSNFLYDEMPTAHYTVMSAGTRYIFREIPGRIIFHEVGDGVEDFLLDRVILEAQEFEPMESEDKAVLAYSYDLYTYDDATFREPVLMIHPRNAGYVGSGDSGTSYDLVRLNVEAQPTTNLYYNNARQTPAGTLNTDDPIVGRESVALVAPMTKFRKMRAEFSTKGYTVVVRSITIVASVMRRRTWG